MNAPYKAMLWYSGHLGWHVFPCRFKVPLTENGLLDATTHPKLIASWAERWPDAGVAVRTGAESGIFALDVDTRHNGDDSLAELVRLHGPFPQTIEAITGGGGRHLIFRHPGQYVKNSASNLGAGLDIRGDGGYIVAAPTTHESGRKYEWEISSRPESVKAADAPPWLLTLLFAKAEQQAGAPAIPELIHMGQRDALLTSLAGSMRRRGASENVILAALSEANATQCVPPLDLSDVQRIAKSVARYSPERMESDGIVNLWDRVAGDRFLEAAEVVPVVADATEWDEVAADLAVGAMFYRLGNAARADIPADGINAAFKLRSNHALDEALAAFTKAARGG